MTQQNWKDHPVSIAALAIAGTIAVGVLLYKEVILPTHTLSLSNEIYTLSKERDELKKEKLAQNNLLASLKNENQALSKQLINMEASNIFITENPYPAGIDQVRIGDKLTKITEIYNKNNFPEASVEIEDDKRYVTVRNANSAFRYITYFINEKKPELTISHISFSGFSMENESSDILQERIISAFGRPDTNPHGNLYTWESAFNTTIFKLHKDSYILMERGYAPGYWPEES